MSAPAKHAQPARPKPKQTSWRVNRRLLEFCRTVHIYLTLLGLLVLLLFGFTGFTLNHENWFGAGTPRVTQAQDQLPTALIASGNSLRIVEDLRQRFHITGAMTDFGNFDDSYAVSFRAPGQYWDVEVNKASGQASVHIEAYNFFAVLNNLHRGRFTGLGWSIIVDLSAVLVVLACVTGVVLWLALPKRRALGVAALALGTMGALLVYLFLVPGEDEANVPAANITAPAATASD